MGTTMTDLFFKADSHKERFITAMVSIGKVYEGTFDPEYAAALYILTADAGLWQQATNYVSNTGIKIQAMIDTLDFSGGPSVLIKLAGNLFNNQHHVDPLEFLRLDESNFQLALTSIKMRRYGLKEENL